MKQYNTNQNNTIEQLIHDTAFNNEEVKMPAPTI